MARATRETSLAPAQPVQGGATDQGMMQMGLTKEEIVELQKVLSLGPGMEQEDEVELDGNSDLTEDLQDTRERVYLVGVELKSQSGSSKKGAKYNIHDSLEELARLANTANLKVCGPVCPDSSLKRRHGRSPGRASEPSVLYVLV